MLETYPHYQVKAVGGTRTPWEHRRSTSHDGLRRRPPTRRRLGHKLKGHRDRLLRPRPRNSNEHQICEPHKPLQQPPVLWVNHMRDMQGLKSEEVLLSRLSHSLKNKATNRYDTRHPNAYRTYEVSAGFHAFPAPFLVPNMIESYDSRAESDVDQAAKGVIITCR